MPILYFAGLAGALLAVLWTSAAGAAFPGANGDLAFMSNRDGDDEIYLAAADGTGVRPLTDDPSADHAPAFSGDGSLVAWESTRSGSFDVFVAPADGSGAAVNVTANPATDGLPALSPDGAKVAFQSDRSGNFDVWVMPVAGGQATNLTQHLASDSSPAFSPDGTKVAFQSNRGGATNIYVVDAAGLNPPVRVTTGGGTDQSANWSPDGQRIVFTSDRAGNDEIYVVNLATGAETRLTEHVAADGVPVFSPDGTRIAFASTRDGDDEVYVMPADGVGTPVQVTANDGVRDREPDWQPRAPRLSVEAISVAEGGEGDVTAAAFTVRLQPAATQTVTVEYETDGVTATAGVDYTGASDTLTFTPGETTKEVGVTILGDDVHEGDETFEFVLSQPAGADIATPVVTGTILDDDRRPITLSVSDVTPPESGNALFTVSHDGGDNQAVEVSYATVAGTATATEDFQPVSGSLDFEPGETSHTVAVPIVPDDLLEPDEQFTLQLSAPVNAVIGDGVGRATISANDQLFIASVAGSGRLMKEGDPPGPVQFQIPLRMFNRTEQPVTVRWRTADATAKAGLDYVAASGELVYVPGETPLKTVAVQLLPDLDSEPDEAFLVVIDPFPGGTDAKLPFYIGNDDPGFVPSVVDLTQTAVQSRAPSISNDGLHVAFQADDPAFDVDEGGFAPDRNAHADVFVASREQYADAPGAVSYRRISVPGDGHEDSSGPSGAPAISGDGRFVAYETLSLGMFARPGDTNNTWDVVRTDRVTRAATAVSTTDGLPAQSDVGNDASGAPAIDGDGDRVGFSSAAANLASSFGGGPNAFVAALTGGGVDTTQVSARPNETPNGASRAVAISDDGSTVAFASDATNLIPGGTSVGNVFVRRLDGSALRLVSAAHGAGGNGPSDRPSLSGDGRYVAFDSAATDLCSQECNALPRDVFVADTAAGGGVQSLPPSNVNSWDPAISDDGRFVAFTTESGGQRNVMVYDRRWGRLENLRDLLEGDSEAPAISADGRFVAVEAPRVDGATQRRHIMAVDRAPVGASIDDGSGPEGRVIEAQLRLTALSDAPRAPEVWVEIVGGTAALGRDFSANLELIPDGRRVIKSRRISATRLSVSIYGVPDQVAEGDESVVLRVLDAFGAHVLDADAVLTIQDGPTPTPTTTPGPTAPAEPAKPKPGESALTGRVFGDVFVLLPDGRVVVLRPGEEVEDGATVDTRKGSVTLTFDDGSGTTSNVTIAGGLAQVGQEPDTRTGTAPGARAAAVRLRPRVRLTGSLPKRCRGRRASRARRLDVATTGPLRSVGRHAWALSAHAARWRIEDRCATTTVRARRGRVSVRDVKRRRTVTLKAGKRYVAPGRRR